MLILGEDSQRTHGRDAQTSNIAAGKAVSEAVRTTLGPRGMDKMLVSDTGDVTITNDGATILNTMDIEHSAAQMILEVAETQDDVGDGTTTAAVLAGELLAKAGTSSTTTSTRPPSSRGTRRPATSRSTPSTSECSTRNSTTTSSGRSPSPA